MSDCPYEIGDKFRFTPSCGGIIAAGLSEELHREVTGTVVQVHEEHRWYRASYETPQGVRHECFKY